MTSSAASINPPNAGFEITDLNRNNNVYQSPINTDMPGLIFDENNESLDFSQEQEFQPVPTEAPKDLGASRNNFSISTVESKSSVIPPVELASVDLLTDNDKVKNLQQQQAEDGNKEEILEPIRSPLTASPNTLISIQNEEASTPFSSFQKHERFDRHQVEPMAGKVNNSVSDDSANATQKRENPLKSAKKRRVIVPQK